ncbi:aminotransferase class IV [Schnuerera sp. xch1]|uniref:aminotransferase class IV n=1 Tax=Schnuerera sp. xch1 TaxID=2874283 RepID=UPI001CC04269|nr:aminotransferase class IV [Schnuerera sp. xch1]MBZ2175857.1 aminotransferase class IV [Schnuerera sp. xch1]
MRFEAIEEYYMVDGNLQSTEDLEIFQGIKKAPIYEVIRIMDGIPLFLKDHLNRMRRSADLVGVSIDREDSQIEKDIKELVLKNKVKNLNIKLLHTDIKGIGQVLLVYFIKSFYPPEQYYKEGIHTILYNYERENPNAKVLKTYFKEEIAKQLEEKNAFEALLVNKDGYITEGSRSNMFFVRKDKIYTAPKGAVLLGITRKYILKICEELNIKVIEENIHIDDLLKLDGVFMSGTSVNVLPIATIDDMKINSVDNKIIREINNRYVNEMKMYISSKREE